MQDSSAPVRFGILGAARIAAKVGPAIQAAENAEWVAIASRSREKADHWAKESSVPNAFGDYQALLDDPEIDAVYIPLPPSLHAEWTIKAAHAGKHVLCEKPLAHTIEDAQQMIAACRENNVQLMDGTMWFHHPRAASMSVRLQQGALGVVQRVTSAFTFRGSHAKDDYRNQRNLGGGAVFDLGWYCIGISLWAFDELPSKVFGSGVYADEVDKRFNGTLWFSDDRIATFDCGYQSAWRCWVEITGTEGSLVCDDFTRPRDEKKARFWFHDRVGSSEEFRAGKAHQETCMVEHFSRLIQTGQIESAWADASMRTLRVCVALDQSARSGKIISLTEHS